MTDPHGKADEPKKGKKAASGKPAAKAPAKAPAKTPAKAPVKPFARGKWSGPNDPHTDDRPSVPAAAPKKSATAAKPRPAKTQTNDPHDVPDDFTPPYEGSPERDGKYPAGVLTCTSEDWRRVCVTVAEVKKVTRLKKGSPWFIQVDVGGRDKTVWAEADVSGVEELPGAGILILDNLEPTKVQNKTCNGKALTAAGAVVPAPSVSPGTRVS